MELKAQNLKVGYDSQIVIPDIDIQINKQEMVASTFNRSEPVQFLPE